MRVLRVYHAGRDVTHRARDRALAGLGVDVTLVVPRSWPEPGHQDPVVEDTVDVVELDVVRAGDVNRHRYRAEDVDAVLGRGHLDVLDLHEPVAVATRQWLRGAPADATAVLYTAQNLDKRLPPPFAQYERAALRRAAGVYACSTQAASVACGKGFTGALAVVPLGLDDAFTDRGRRDRAADSRAVRLGLVGRLTPVKAPGDAVRVLAGLRAHPEATLHVVGSGPEAVPLLTLADRLGVAGRVVLESWLPAEALAQRLRELDVLLVPSLSTDRWAEQYGRVILEAQACGAVVAAYASGAIPEVIGSCGVVVPPGDVAGLTSAVEQLLAQPERMVAMAADGVVRAAGRRWAAVARAQLDLYERALRGERHPAGRAEARRRFGAPALAGAQERPFALPVLRTDNPGSRALAAGLDLLTATATSARGERP